MYCIYYKNIVGIKAWTGDPGGGEEAERFQGRL